MKKWVGLFFVVTILFSLIPFVSSAPSDVFERKEVDAGLRGYVAEQIVVKFKFGVSDQAISEVVSRLGCQVAYRSPFSETYVLQFPVEKAVDGMLSRFRGEPVVEYAQASYGCSASWVPNDPLYSYQWHFDMINMEEAWDVASGGSSSVVVAVLDTGVAYETYLSYKQAPDLAGTTFVAGYDFVNNDVHPNDDEGHGTHVCGTIAQTTNNGIGVAGIAFNTAVMPVKVLNASGSGNDLLLADGIRWATDHGAHVISMSLGFDPEVEAGDVPDLTEAVQYAYSQGVILVASSGNDGGGVVSLPAAYPEVMAVGAVHSGGERADYSQYGEALDFVAPGGDNVDRDGDGNIDGVLQQTFDKITENPNTWVFDYYLAYGTSMAAPHVSGVIALLIANGNADADEDGVTSSDEVRAVLQSTATDLGSVGRDNEYGWGLVDAGAALQSEQYTLTVNTVGSGSVIKDPGKASYASGAVVTLNATPAAGWNFTGWSEDLTGNTNPTTITMNSNKTVSATFTEAATTQQNVLLAVRGNNNMIYYRLYDTILEDWSSWGSLPGSTMDAPAAAILDNQLHIVVRGMDGTSLWHGYYDLTSEAFSGWTNLEGSTPSSPVLTSNGSMLCLVVQGEDDLIYYRCYSEGAWGDWQLLPDGSTIDSPAAALLGDELHVVVRGMDGYSMWHKIIMPEGSVIQDWTWIPGASASPLVLATSQSRDELYMLVRGADDGIYQCEYDGSWGSWLSLEGLTVASPAAAVKGDQLHVIVWGSDAVTLWYGAVDLNSMVFGGWSWISGSTSSKPVLTS